MTTGSRTAGGGTGTITTLRPRAVETTPDADGTLAVPVTWGGHTVDAPGFDQDRFDRAMARAFIDDLRLEPLPGDAFLVHFPGSSRGHYTTRETCTCPAGQHDVPCKHRALVIAHRDVRAPELAKRTRRRLRRRQAARAEQVARMDKAA